VTTKTIALRPWRFAFETGLFGIAIYNFGLWSLPVLLMALLNCDIELKSRTR
jgi:hypothetical protein